jgi:hypothetical protein
MPFDAPVTSSPVGILRRHSRGILFEPLFALFFRERLGSVSTLLSEMNISHPGASGKRHEHQALAHQMAQSFCYINFVDFESTYKVGIGNTLRVTSPAATAHFGLQPAENSLMQVGKARIRYTRLSVCHMERL